MKPYKQKVQIGDCTLYLGDALEIMPALDDVDCAVFDPPYLLTSGGKSGELGGKLGIDQYDNGGAIVECDIDWEDFMPLVFDCLAENAHAYVMANNRHVENMLNSARAAGFRFHNLLNWKKNTATPNRWYMKDTEFTGFFYKGKAFQINNCGSKQTSEVPNVRNAEHPTQKPVELMALYVENSTQRLQTVLDPFMGSCSTGVACVKLDRKFIGIEKDEKHFFTACGRIQNALDQGEMFRHQSHTGITELYGRE